MLLGINQKAALKIWKKLNGIWRKLVECTKKIKEEIIKHEGKINKIYKDHLGNATFGVGHLVLPTDDLQEGVEYDDAKIMEFFERDFDQAVKDARSFTKEENIDPVAFGCVINMAFQLGLPRLSKFKNFQYHLKQV